MAGEGRENEAAEKPVREQLKKASIAGIDAAALEAGRDTDMGQAKEDESKAGLAPESGNAPRLHKKRSFEEVEDLGQAGKERHHTRKRSREGTAEEGSSEQNGNNGNKRKVSGELKREGSGLSDADTNGAAKLSAKRAGTPDQADDKKTESAAEEMSSPKIKRSRLHSKTAGGETEAAKDNGETASTDKEAGQRESAGSSENKIPPSSGFANTSAVSPFGALAGSKSPPFSEAQTSSSAFAASGFGALAGSSTSGFGAIGKTSGGFGSGGGFGPRAKSPLAEAKKGEEKHTGSTFGGALGATSAFGTTGASGGGFGSGTSGFGSGLGGSGFGTVGSGSGLTSFASGKSTPLTSSAKATSAFGAPADDDAEGEGEDDDGGEEGGAESKTPLAVEEDPKDERFYAQEIETGEEKETTEFSARAKLYNWVTLDDGKKEWRERGLGVLRLNVRPADEDAEDQKPQARFLMRADGSHRVVLNTPVKKQIKFGKPDGGPPTNGFLYFMGTIGENTGLELLQLKMRQQFAMEVYEKVQELQKEM